MRIAIYWEDLLHYHVARIKAAKRLATMRGDEVCAYAIRPASPELPLGGYHDLLADEVEVLATDPTVAGPNAPSSASALVARLERHQPDAVAIVGYDNRVALAALQWCRRNKRGAILMTESQRSDFQRSASKEWLKQRLASCFDAALVGGKAHVSYAQDLGFSPEQIFTGYDVVDNTFWTSRSDSVRTEPEAWRVQLSLPSQYFLTASRLVQKKNVAGLLRAYGAYASQAGSNPWPLLIAGDGILRDELETLASSLKLDGLVRFLGYLSAEQMAPVYALASVFILASSHSEQWGLVVNEAMAARLPVLVSRVCGCVPDLVLDGITGFAFNPADNAHLTSLLVGCASGQFDLLRMGQEARRQIALYSPEVFAQNLMDAATAATNYANQRGVNPTSRLYPTLVSRLIR